MKSLKIYAPAVVLILALLFSNLSCSLLSRDQSKSVSNAATSAGNQTSRSVNLTTTAAVTTRPHSPLRSGELTLGPKVDLTSQAVGKDGGGIAVSKAGDPLDGFTLGVPPQAANTSRTFKVSYSPVTKQTFGDDFVPASPLITIDNGGGLSNELNYLQVPVKIPEGYVAMGFLYDDKTKQLEGLPLITQDSGSVTVATRHFSSFIIGMINKTKLKENVDSGFTPGIDDWQFTNYGSYIAPGGHCEGQSLSEMWYYCIQPDGKDYCLYGRYDNNGNQPATPNFWGDDSLGYRFASSVHEDNNQNIGTAQGGAAYFTWAGLAGRVWKQVNNQWQWVNVPKIIDDGTTRDLFAFAIQMTGEPQLIKIQDDSGGGGHTMVVYKTVGNALYIADPNYPGVTDRKVIYYSGEGKFKPYNSGANRADIEAGKGTSYNHIMYFGKSTLVDWGTISKRWAELKKGAVGNDLFPAYKVVYRDESGNYKEVTDGMTFNVNKVLFGTDFSGTLAGLNVYRDGAALPWDANGKFELKPGNNQLGFWVTKKIGNENLYVDFKYLNVKFEDNQCKTPPPKDMLDKLQKTTTFRCELLNLPTTIDGKGSMNKWVPGFKFTKHFYVPGNAIAVGGEGAMAIKWSGTSFSGGGSAAYPDRLSGSVCYNNGKLMVSFDYATNDPKDNLVFSVKNVPCDPQYFMDSKYAVDGKSALQYATTQAPVVKGYVTTLEWKSHEERLSFNGPPEVWDAVLTAADWSKQCGFDLFFK